MTDDDIDEFRKAMKGVTPLKDPGKISRERPRPARVRRAATEESIPTRGLSDAIPHPVGPDDILSYVQTGVNRQDWKALRLGQLMIHARLDLHGNTVDQARSELEQFIHHQRSLGSRVLYIIHGKGGRGPSPYPLLKNLVASWLQQIPDILAYHSAIPRDGGPGSLYVLLKNKSF